MILFKVVVTAYFIICLNIFDSMTVYKNDLCQLDSNKIMLHFVQWTLFPGLIFRTYLWHKYSNFEDHTYREFQHASHFLFVFWHSIYGSWTIK